MDAALFVDADCSGDCRSSRAGHANGNRSRSSVVTGHRRTLLATDARYALGLCTMPGIHRQSKRRFWFCAFSIFNPETLTSKRVFRSTKTENKKQAEEICRAWHKAALKARNG